MEIPKEKARVQNRVVRKIYLNDNTEAGGCPYWWEIGTLRATRGVRVRSTSTTTSIAGRLSYRILLWMKTVLGNCFSDRFYFLSSHKRQNEKEEIKSEDFRIGACVRDRVRRRRRCSTYKCDYLLTTKPEAYLIGVFESHAFSDMSFSFG